MTKIGAYSIENMTETQKMRFRNPECITEINLMPAKNGASFIDIPEHKVAALRDGDPEVADMVRDEFYKKGLRGRFQIRAARGGVGAGRHMNIQIGLRTGAISTQGKGFELIVRDFLV